jgi:hypothetical protein
MSLQERLLAAGIDAGVLDFASTHAISGILTMPGVPFVPYVLTVAVLTAVASVLDVGGVPDLLLLFLLLIAS